MKIAIAQLNYTIGDIDGNTSKIIDSINKAKGPSAEPRLSTSSAKPRSSNSVKMRSLK